MSFSFYILLLINFIIVFLVRLKPNLSLLIYFPVLLFFFYMSFFHPKVGIDILMYKEIFYTLDYTLYPLEIDYGFKAYTEFIRLFTSVKEFYLFITQLMIILVIGISVSILKKQYIAIYICLLCTTFLLYNISLNVLRQGVSISFLFLSFSLYVTGKKKSSIFFYLISLSFHSASLVVLPILLFKKVTLNKTLFFSIVLSFMMFGGQLLGHIAGFLASYHWVFDRVARYTNWVYSTGFEFKLYHISMLLLTIYYWYFIKVNKNFVYGEVILKTLIFSFVISSASSFDQMVSDRLYYFFFLIGLVAICDIVDTYIKRYSFGALLFISFTTIWAMKTYELQFERWFVDKLFMA